MYYSTLLVAYFFISIVYNLILLKWPFLVHFWICLISQFFFKVREFTIILFNDFILQLFVIFSIISNSKSVIILVHCLKSLNSIPMYYSFYPQLSTEVTLINYPELPFYNIHWPWLIFSLNLMLHDFTQLTIGWFNYSWADR